MKEVSILIHLAHQYCPKKFRTNMILQMIQIFMKTMMTFRLKIIMKIIFTNPQIPSIISHLQVMITQQMLMECLEKILILMISHQFHQLPKSNHKELILSQNYSCQQSEFDLNHYGLELLNLSLQKSAILF